MENLEIELSEAIAEGQYVNLAIISHSSSEFVIDFVRVMPGMPKAPVKSRVVLSHQNAKRLLLSLQDNIAKYEAVFGKIKISEQDEAAAGAFPIGFSSGEA